MLSSTHGISGAVAAARSPCRARSAKCSPLAARHLCASSSSLGSARLTGRLSCRSMRGRSVVYAAKEVGEKDFDSEVLQADVPVLVDFWATWCGPCKIIGKVVDQVEAECAGKVKVVKIETDPNPALVEKYGVYGLPTLILFKDGKIVDGSKREGAISKDKLIQYLQSYGAV